MAAPSQQEIDQLHRQRQQRAQQADAHEQRDRDARADRSREGVCVRDLLDQIPAHDANAELVQREAVHHFDHTSANGQRDRAENGGDARPRDDLRQQKAGTRGRFEERRGYGERVEHHPRPLHRDRPASYVVMRRGDKIVRGQKYVCYQIYF